MRISPLVGTLFAAIGVTVWADTLEEQLRNRVKAEQADRVLSLQDCIQLALENNLDVQIRRLDPEVAGFELRSSYAGYDPSFSLSGQHSYELSPGGLDDQGRSFSGTESEIDRFSGSLGGLLPWGTRYTFGASLSDRYGNAPGSIRDPNTFSISTNTLYDTGGNPALTYVTTNYGTLPTRNPFESASANVGFFELRQPLLKNFLTDSTRLQIFLGKKNLERSELDLRGQLMDTITSVEEAYYNFIYTDESVKVQEKAMELAERLVAENRRRVEVGALAPLDEKQAESEAASRRADLLEAQARRGTQLRALKQLLSDNYSEWMLTNIRPTESLRAVPQPLVLQESWRKGMSARPELLQARLDVDMQTQRVKYQRNQRLPQLDLVGDFGYTGSDDEFSSAFRQVRRTENSYYSYGAQLTVPLGNVGPRNSYKAALTTKEQLALRLKQFEQSVLVEIENEMATARTSLQRVEATHQARLYAEDAYAGFLPQTGRIDVWRPATGAGVRIDHGMKDGLAISPFYDPMIAKVIAHGATREQARARLVLALRETVVLGPTTNRHFLVRLLEHPAFAAGEATTAFLGQHDFPGPAIADAHWQAAATLLWREAAGRWPAPLRGWRNSNPEPTPIRLAAGGQERLLLVTGDEPLPAGVRHVVDGDDIVVDLDAFTVRFTDRTWAPPAAAAAGSDGTLRAPMDGRIVAIKVAAGDTVARGQTLVVLEAMKIQHQLKAGLDARIESVAVTEGQQVSNRTVLVTLAASGDAAAS